MTDTGQIPAEGLPENAGMVEQPGVPAHGAYTYLSETTAEDEDLLLLPGAQGAWGNEVPPPAPEPVVETLHEPAPHEAAANEPGPAEVTGQDPGPYEVAAQDPGLHEGALREPGLYEAGPHEAAAHEAAAHEPGPHETAGRDSGSVDLGGVRLPASPPPAPVPPRRPLHLGPPLPDTSASPVRSLADRGPAGAPVRQQGPPTTGPEYFDAPQLRDLPPQGAAPWGAQAPVSAGVQTAETVVPVGEPDGEPVGAAQATPAAQAAHASMAGFATEAVGGGIAMALDAGVVVPEPEPAPVMGASASTGKDAGLAQAPDAGGAWQGHGQLFAGEPAAAFAHVSTESSGNAGLPEAGQLPEGAEDLAAGQDQAQVQVQAPVQTQVQAQVDVPGSDAGFAPVGDGHGGDAGYVPEGAGAFEAVPVAGDAFAAGPGSVPEDAFAVGAGQEPEQFAASDPVPGADVAPESEVVPGSEEAFASEAEVLPDAVGVAAAGEGFDAGFAAADEQGVEAEPVYAAEQLVQPLLAQGPEEVQAQDVAPEPVLVHDVTPNPEAVAAPEPVQAEDVVYAPAPDQVLEAPHTHEITPVDEIAAIQEAERTPPDFPGVETPLTPESAHLADTQAEAAPAPEPVVAESHVTETAAPEATGLIRQADDASFSTGVPLEPQPQPQPELQPQPRPDDSLGRFVPVEGSVPTPPHHAPTP
ncbi:hypothetical protein ACFWP5_41090, partial [Streptomyces sp. NPDC058469]